MRSLILSQWRDLRIGVTITTNDNQGDVYCAAVEDEEEDEMKKNVDSRDIVSDRWENCL